MTQHDHRVYVRVSLDKSFLDTYATKYPGSSVTLLVNAGLALLETNPGFIEQFKNSRNYAKKERNYENHSENR